jgi:hypothetical protein
MPRLRRSSNDEMPQHTTENTSSLNTTHPARPFPRCTTTPAGHQQAVPHNYKTAGQALERSNRTPHPPHSTSPHPATPLNPNSQPKRRIPGQDTTLLQDRCFVTTACRRGVGRLQRRRAVSKPPYGRRQRPGPLPGRNLWPWLPRQLPTRRPIQSGVQARGERIQRASRVLSTGGPPARECAGRSRAPAVGQCCAQPMCRAASDVPQTTIHAA